MISINGAELPAPTDFQVGIMDISKAERNANGEMIIERIATKRKLELTWKNLSKEETSKLLKSVSPIFFNTTYIDPQDNSEKTGTFYCGDRTNGMLGFINGEPYWKSIKFNLIER
ncbi:DUF6711 family protein [Clostridium algidicarnis]|uniref:DUF6711 family protein n=1 Tax=Clostridium algidicarnis TaxID=37659 RepID=UPI001C0B263E|nr:DUF6711 family protein [Clostridium algidicarnis]MBU3226810.1 hypothetical protein [Clostridium algidicarnis]MBU3250279.1 hypothetical protein [Clostridium algidicarnis]